MHSSVLPFSSAPSGSNATTQLILSRRSVRDKFTDQQIPREAIVEILRCGLAAPSSKNARPWRLHVVTDRGVLKELADAVASADGADTYVPRDPETGLTRTDWPSSVSESADTLRGAPLGIFIENLGAFSKGRKILSAVPRENLRGSLVGYTFEVLGIGAAIMNMWLAANALGAQAAFMGDVCVAEKAIAEKLGIKCDLIGVLVVGYSTAKPSPQRVHYDVSDEMRVVWHAPASVL